MQFCAAVRHRRTIRTRGSARTAAPATVTVEQPDARALLAGARARRPGARRRCSAGADRRSRCPIRRRWRACRCRRRSCRRARCRCASCASGWATTSPTSGHADSGGDDADGDDRRTGPRAVRRHPAGHARSRPRRPCRRRDADVAGVRRAATGRRARRAHRRARRPAAAERERRPKRRRKSRRGRASSSSAARRASSSSFRTTTCRCSTCSTSSTRARTPIDIGEPLSSTCRRAPRAPALLAGIVDAGHRAGRSRLTLTGRFRRARRRCRSASRLPYRGDTLTLRRSGRPRSSSCSSPPRRSARCRWPRRSSARAGSADRAAHAVPDGDGAASNAGDTLTLHAGGPAAPQPRAARRRRSALAVADPGRRRSGRRSAGAGVATSARRSSPRGARSCSRSSSRSKSSIAAGASTRRAMRRARQSLVAQLERVYGRARSHGASDAGRRRRAPGRVSRRTSTGRLHASSASISGGISDAARRSRRSPSNAMPAKSSACSGRTAPASRRCSPFSRRCSRRRPAAWRTASATRETAGAALRARLGLLGHDLYLYPELTARENLLFFARLYGLADAAARVDARRSSTAALTERADDPGRRLLARHAAAAGARAGAACIGPRLLLLDEPFTGLDQASAAALVARLRDCRSEGCLILLATHDLEVAEGLLSRVAVPAQTAALAPTTRRRWTAAPLRDRVPRGDERVMKRVLRASRGWSCRRISPSRSAACELVSTTLFFAVIVRARLCVRVRQGRPRRCATSRPASCGLRSRFRARWRSGAPSSANGRPRRCGRCCWRRPTGRRSMSASSSASCC